MLYEPMVPVTFEALRDMPVLDGRNGGEFTLRAVLVPQNILPAGATPMYVYEVIDGNGTPTGIYNPTILTTKDVPISITWENDLPPGHILPYDPSVMHMMSGGMMMPTDPTMPAVDPATILIPTVAHVHGGHTAAIYDGFPTTTILPGEAQTFTYDNSQEGGVLWYHDHAMGLTRLNNYAGLVGVYEITDDNRIALADQQILPDFGTPFEKDLMIADKSFNTDGSLYYPGNPDDPLPGTLDPVTGLYETVFDAVGGQAYVDAGGAFPSAVPEYFGNAITVNGQLWPADNVGQGVMKYNIVNGSDSRFYTLQLDNPNVKVTLVGNDAELLEKPIVIMDGDGIQEAGEQLTFAPSDRFELLFDFSNVADGEQVKMLNYGAAYEPFKGLDGMGNNVAGVQAADPTVDPIGTIMAFNVDATLPAYQSNITDTTILNPNYVAMDEADSTVTRKLGFFEQADALGRVMPLVGVAGAATDMAGNPIDTLNAADFGTVEGNNLVFDGLGWSQPTTEIITLDPTTGVANETWEFFNVSADAHPLHIHLNEFEVVARYQLTEVGLGGDTNGDGVILRGEKDYENDFGALLDTRDDLPGIQNLRPEDMGGQDTIWVGPGEGVKILTTFDRPGDYVWHCHILSHEDYDMMRPIKVIGVAGDFAGTVLEDSVDPATGLVEIGTLDSALQGFVPGPIVGQYGTLTIGQTGEWTYQLDNTLPAVQALNAGEVGTDVLTITELGGATHQIAIDVLGQDEVNVIVVGDAGGYFEGTDGNDDFRGGAGQDVFNGGLGNDIYDGAGGDYNQVDFAGAACDYTFTRNSDGTVTVDHPTEGTDLLKNIQGVWFNGEAKWYALSDLAGNAPIDPNAVTVIETGDAGGYFEGTDGKDDFHGGAGNDVFNGGLGDDIYDGAGGDYNQVDYSGSASDYTFTRNDDGTVTISHPTEGTDTLTNIDGLWFNGEAKWYALSDLAGNAPIDPNAVNIVETGDAGGYFVGTDGKDDFRGGAGNDVFNGGLGDDIYDGAGGDYNQVDYSGSASDYTFTRNDDGTVTISHTTDGTDILKNIDGLWFNGEAKWYALDDLTTGGPTSPEVVNIIEAGRFGGYFEGTAGNDDFRGGDGWDFFHGGAGDDIYDGAGGLYNQVNLDGHFADYTFSTNAEGAIVASHADYGNDILKNIDGVWLGEDFMWVSTDDLVPAAA